MKKIKAWCKYCKCMRVKGTCDPDKSIHCVVCYK